MIDWGAALAARVAAFKPAVPVVPVVAEQQDLSKSAGSEPPGAGTTRWATVVPVVPPSKPEVLPGTTGTTGRWAMVPGGSDPKLADFCHSQGVGTTGTTGTTKNDHAQHCTPGNRGPAGADAEAWRTWMGDRLGDRLRLGWQRNDALSATWGEAEVLWHERHGARPDRHHCAGCQEPLAGHKAMPLADGTRVHWDDGHGLDCLIAYGRRWRGAAAAGLAKLGLTAPPSATPTPLKSLPQPPQPQPKPGP